MGKKVIANQPSQLIDDTKHPLMGNQSTSTKNLLFKKNFSPKTIKANLYQEYGGVLTTTIETLKENQKFKASTNEKHIEDQNIEPSDILKRRLISVQEKLSAYELQHTQSSNELIHFQKNKQTDSNIRKIELEKQIALQNMTNIQEKLNNYEIEFNKLKNELSKLKEKKPSHINIKKIELENKIAVQNMMSIQEKLTTIELEHQKTQKELYELKQIPFSNHNVKTLEMENLKLKQELTSLKEQKTLNHNFQKIKLENKIALQNMLNIQEKLNTYELDHITFKNEKYNAKTDLALDTHIKNIELENLKLKQELANSKEDQLSNNNSRKNELEKNIALKNMLNVQEKLSMYELENQNLKAELFNLNQIKTSYENIKNYEVENQQLKNKLYELEQKIKENINAQKLKIENKIMFKTMLNVQEQLGSYKLENEILKEQLNNLNLNSPQENINIQNKSTIQEQTLIKLTGAKYRVQNDLPYQIGKTMIDCSRTLNGSIKMPFMIYQKIKNEENGVDNNLPPLSEYADAHEVDIVKNHLSYRLGDVVINAIHNPKDALKLPLKIGTEILKFKLKK